MKSILSCFAYVIMSLAIIGCGGEEKDFIDRMETEHQGDEPVANASSNYSSTVQVDTQNVTYATVNGTEVTGYLAKPDNSEGQTPGIIVIHEWWGLNDNIRMMTRRLAEQGYTALAVDLYMGNPPIRPTRRESWQDRRGRIRTRPSLILNRPTPIWMNSKTHQISAPLVGVLAAGGPCRPRWPCPR